MFRSAALMFVLVLFVPGHPLAEEVALLSSNQAEVAGASSAQPDDAIAPGTRITMQNWQTFKQFMPDGMVALFQGTYFWKMPADVSMEVGPTVTYPLPKNYLEATAKYSSQVINRRIARRGTNTHRLSRRDPVSESRGAAQVMEGTGQPLVSLYTAADRGY